MPNPIIRRVEIAAPVAVVWRHVDEEPLIKAWMPEIVGIRYHDGARPAQPLGARFVQSIREGGRIKDYDGLVTAYTPPQLLGVRLGDASFQVDITYRLEEAAETSTILHYACATTPVSWMARVMMPVGRLVMGRMLDTYLKRLRMVCETAASA